MSDEQQIARENAALRERIASLCAAMLRITGTLDVETVLQEIVDSARALASARYGVIATIDAGGRPVEYVMSGFTAEEERRIAEAPDGMALFGHLRDLAAPLRLDDVAAYVGEFGLSPDATLSGTLQAVPMRHRGVLVGSFVVAEKEGASSFTDEDEDVLALFAGLAAAAVANARAHRDERRARADLEVLIETSPVGVVVMDGRTSEPVSINREAARIIDRLRTPGRPEDALLKEVTCRRANGTELAFAEFPFSVTLNASEPVCAEEIVLSVPDGRSVSMLVNSTPIHAEDGSVVSLVVTMQDLAALDEMERQRTEFLSLVSHELRAPLSAIKGSATTVLHADQELDPLETREFFRIVDQQADHMRALIADLLDAGRIETGTLSVSTAPSELAALVDRARKTFESAGGRHALHIDIPSDLPPVMADRQRVVQVLNNLLANASRHDPASATIGVDAAVDGAFVAVSVTDHGTGISPDRLADLFRKHSGLPGRARHPGGGLGLAICKGLVEAHGGRIKAEIPDDGRGTRVTFTLPTVSPGVGDAADAATASPAQRPRGERILVVDDDPRALRFVRNALAEAGYAPLVAADPATVPGIIRAEQPRLVLLDLVLPNTDGIELLERVPELSDLPVIIISAYGRDETIARALEVGAADYIVKPFSPTELVARIRAILRRQPEEESFELGDLAIRYDARAVTLAGQPVVLTAKEYDLLRVLATNAGRVTTYETLQRRVWGRCGRGAPQLIRTFIKKLRRKLADDPASPTYILNERAVGYRMPRPGDTA